MSFSFFFQKFWEHFVCSVILQCLYIEESIKGKFFNSKLNIYININLNSKILIH